MAYTSISGISPFGPSCRENKRDRLFGCLVGYRVLKKSEVMKCFNGLKHFLVAQFTVLAYAFESLPTQFPWYANIITRRTWYMIRGVEWSWIFKKTHTT